MQEKILVVDDEKEIGELLRDYLESAGYRVILAFDGLEAYNLFTSHKPDMAILDVMLPKMNGFELCKKIREESNIPILMLSAKKSEGDKIEGLSCGADDYIVKPFSPRELTARVKAQFRRFNQLGESSEGPGLMEFVGLGINPKGHSVEVRGDEVSLSAKEFEVLKLFATNPNIVMTREEIFDRVWGYQEFGDINTVAVHIRKLREKIEIDPSNPEYIRTIWGVGYKFVGKPV